MGCLFKVEDNLQQIIPEWVGMGEKGTVGSLNPGGGCKTLGTPRGILNVNICMTLYLDKHLIKVLSFNPKNKSLFKNSPYNSKKFSNPYLKVPIWFSFKCSFS